MNTQQYWENRFSRSSWNENHGKEQTQYFARLLKDNIPEWLVEDINANSSSVVDLGCALGDAVPIFGELFHGKLIGIDFSPTAIEYARTTYPQYEYLTGDITHLEKTYDVGILSNVLEHFKNPISVLSALSNHINHHLLVMVPFEEEMDIEEHEFHFDFSNIPLSFGSFSLLYYKLLFCDDKDTYSLSKQLLLVYTANQTILGKTSIGQSAKIIEDLRALEPGQLREALAKTRHELKNELQVSHNAYIKIEELNNKVQELEDEALKTSETLSAIRDELSAVKDKLLNAESELTNTRGELSKAQSELSQMQTNNILLQQEITQLTQSEQEWEEKHSNLYRYSCQRDNQLMSILNSRSYQVFVKYIKPCMHIGYKIAKKMQRVVKALFTLHLKDFCFEISSPFRKIAQKVKAKMQTKQLLKQMAVSFLDKRVIVLPPTLDWSMPLFQRPQQLAIAYAKKPDTVVVYMTKNIQYDHVAFAQKSGDNIWIVNELYLDRLCSILGGARQTILSLSWTPNKFYCDKIAPDKLIYEYIDELEIFHMYGPEMEADHRNLMNRADVTVCTATKLYNQIAQIAKNPIVSTNAGDYDFFANTSNYDINPLIAERIQGYECVLGYYGALAKWFDYELVKAVAAAHPEWVWVLVGINYDRTLDKSGFEKYDNIIVIPPQPYKELPSFLTAFTIATIPFQINEITLSTSPVKLFEYMAGGKAILTSKMPECLKYESVKTYQNVEEFCSLTKELLLIQNDKSNPYWEVLQKEAKANTWDAKTDEILRALEA